MPAFDWYNKIPPSWNIAANRTQWADMLPPMTLPNGKVWVPPIGEYSTTLARSKGANMFSKFELTGLSSGDLNALINAGLTYNAVPRPESAGFLGLPVMGPESWKQAPNGTYYNEAYYPNGPLTYAQARAKADIADITHRLFIGETEEGPSWIRPDDEQWLAFYERFMERMLARHTLPGLPPLVAHNYFNYFGSAPANNGWWLLGGASAAEAKAEFAKPVSAWGLNQFSPGSGSLRHTNLIIEGWYKGSFDTTDKDLTRMMFKHQVYKKMGYYAGTVCATNREWRPNNQTAILFPEEEFPGSGNWGAFFRSDKIPYDSTIIASVAFWTLKFANVFADWGNGGKSTKINIGHGWNSYDYWFPNQVNAIGAHTGQEPQANEHRNFTRHAIGFPYYSAHNSDPNQRSTPHNGSMIGASQYGQTFGVNEGGVDYFPQFRINGGPWIVQEPIVANAIVDAHHTGNPLVVATIKPETGKMSIAMVQERGTGLAKGIEIKHPLHAGVTYNSEFAGHGTHSVLINE